LDHLHVGGVSAFFPEFLCGNVTLRGCNAYLFFVTLTDLTSPSYRPRICSISRSWAHSSTTHFLCRLPLPCATFHTPPEMTEMTGHCHLLYFNFVFPDSMLIFQSKTGERQPTQRHTQSLAPHPWTPPSPLLTENVQALGTKG
jgi:hypothetical protein